MISTKKGKLIVISGPSGVGKTTLYKKILEEFNKTINFSISVTTRKPRAGEKNGIDYYFISEDEFKQKIDNDEFTEWAKVHNNYYGTLKSQIKNIVDKGRHCLLDVDTQGGMNIKKIFPESHLIFILPPSVEVLKKRLSKRATDSKEALQTRIKNAIEEMEFASRYENNIINDDLDAAYRELKKVIEKIIVD